MPFISKNDLKVYQFGSFSNLSVTHGIFTRIGGVSPAPWDSLNLGGTVGDSRENIIQNRSRIFEAIDRQVESIHDVWQVHGTDILCVNQPRNLTTEPIKADAIITNVPGITLFMRFADCVPILICDKKRHTVAIVHAGWQGTIGCIVQKTIQAMISLYECQPGDLVAGIGPSIGPDHYEVGEDVAKPVMELFTGNWNEVLHKKDGSWYFNLWTANEILLMQSGIMNIEHSNECTACHTGRWYSHRAERGQTGRFAGLIGVIGHD